VEDDGCGIADWWTPDWTRQSAKVKECAADFLAKKEK